jgi:hypothetical protein
MDPTLQQLKKDLQKDINVVLLNLYNGTSWGEVIKNPFDENAKPRTGAFAISYKPVKKTHSLDQYLLSFNSITDIQIYENKEGIRVLEISFATIPTLECVIKNFNEFYFNHIKTNLDAWMKNFSNEDLAKDNLYKQRGYKI